LGDWGGLRRLTNPSISAIRRALAHLRIRTRADFGRRLWHPAKVFCPEKGTSIQTFILDDYPWDIVESTKRFITQLFFGEPPDRPAAIIHPAATAEPPQPPAHLSAYERDAWTQVEGIRRRPVGADDFVPALSTTISTCALATAFGAREEKRGDVTWVKPALTSNDDIDHLRMPAVTDGRLGEVLERTRVFAGVTDERLPIRVMDFQSPFTTVEQLLGSERFFTVQYDDPARLHHLMDAVTDFAIEFFKTQAEVAGDRVCLGSWPPIWFPPGAGPHVSEDNIVNVSPEAFEEFALPYSNRIAEAFGGFFLHSCVIKEKHLPSIMRLEHLRGYNCDISDSAPVSFFLERLPDDVVFAPHAYTNADTNFAGFGDFFRACLEHWNERRRLFIYPCPVMYIPERAEEITFDEASARAELEKLPGWRRDHGPVTA
jgi:hypothetical protein